MFTFLIACIPLILLIVVCSNGSFSWKSFIPPIVFGFLVAFVFCFSRKFMIFNKYVWTTNQMAGAMNIFMWDIVLPFISCLAVFLIFDRSSLLYKAESLAPLMLTFYAILVPFQVLTGDDRTAAFMVFGKPLLYAGMVLFLSVFASFGMDFFKKKIYVLGAVFVILSLVFLFVPALVESLWFYSGAFFYVLASIVFAGAGLAFYLLRNIIKAILLKVESKKIAQ